MQADDAAARAAHEMFWEHADTDTYLRWLRAAGLTPQWHRYIAEGAFGHSLILARAA